MTTPTFGSPSTATDVVVTRRVGILAGSISMLGLIGGFIALVPIEDIGNPDALNRGLAEVAAHSVNAIAAGWIISAALIAGVVFIWTLARMSRPRATPLLALGAGLTTVGAVLNCIGLIGLVVLGHVLAPASLGDPGMHAASLALSAGGLALDAAYNFLLGLGLVAFGVGMWRCDGWPKPMGALAVVAGLLSLPVVLEWYSNAAGEIQYLGEALIFLWQLGMTRWLWRVGRTP